MRPTARSPRFVSVPSPRPAYYWQAFTVNNASAPPFRFRDGIMARSSFSRHPNDAPGGDSVGLGGRKALPRRRPSTTHRIEGPRGEAGSGTLDDVELVPVR